MTLSYVVITASEIETWGTESSWSSQMRAGRRYVFIRRPPPIGPAWSDGGHEKNLAATLNSKDATTEQEKIRFVFSFPQ